MRPRLLLPLLLLAAACTRAPVRWGDVASAAGAPLTGPVAPDGAPAVAPLALPADAAGVRCDSLVRVVPLDSAGARLVALWWSVRADSSAHLLSARSADRGATWSAPVPVDTVDRAGLGCARPAPAVAFDPAGGYVHVAYWMRAPEGAGVFFAHSMDEGGMYHAPVPIVYGERPARTSVAAHRDTVAVAYEDPNTRVPQVALALSRTAGHIFEQKLVPVSAGAHPAQGPRVAVHGRTVAVAWHEVREDGAVAVRREGEIQ